MHPSGKPFGCKKCKNCRITRNRIWAHRLMLEGFTHEFSSFVTLTYSPEFLPPGGSLSARDLRLFMYRLRARLKPHRLRFYAVGEYGTRSLRPHYHLALYGLPALATPLIESAWTDPKSKLPIGQVHVGELTHDSALYISRYVLKKRPEPSSPLASLPKEFSRMSNRPGIGAPAIPALRDVLTTAHGCDALAEAGDVPNSLLIGSRAYPLGSYVRKKLRDALHFPSSSTPPEALLLWQQTLAELQAEAALNPSDLSKYLSKNERFRRFLLEKNAQKRLNRETRSKIFEQKDVF